MDYFAPKLSPDELRAISAIGLAHMGDAVYELLVRTWLCVHGKATGKELHRATVALVCAPEQARRAAKVLPLLTEEETAVYKRGRQRTHHPPQRQPRGIPRRHGAGMSAGLAVPPGRQGPHRGAVQRDDGGRLICRWMQSVYKASWRS